MYRQIDTSSAPSLRWWIALQMVRGQLKVVAVEGATVTVDLGGDIVVPSPEEAKTSGDVWRNELAQELDAQREPPGTQLASG